MQNTLKLQSLNCHKLPVVDLGGLISETIIAGKEAEPFLGELGGIALKELINADSAFRTNLITVKSSPLTEQIMQLDKKRDNGFFEVKRTSKTASKSSNPNIAEAGRILEDFLKPYQNLAREPIMSETSTLNYLQTQYNINPTLQAAATTLQLTDVFADIFAVNEQVAILWNERAVYNANKSGPSPSSLKSNLEKTYHDFCDIVIQTLKLQPNPALETLFSVMNGIRVKYSRFLPIRLTDTNILVDPIAVQKYTGKNITPITRVFIKKENEEFNELRFTIDFYITYKNNIAIGEAQIIIHGKGKYTGTYTSTFHIERE